MVPPLLHSNIVGIVCSVLTPYMLNPGAWNWGNYAGFFWVSIESKYSDMKEDY